MTDPTALTAEELARVLEWLTARGESEAVHVIEAQAATIAARTEELDEAHSALAYIADRMNEEIRQEGCGPELQGYRDRAQFRAGLRMLGDRLIQRRRERDEARAELASLRRERDALLREFNHFAPYFEAGVRDLCPDPSSEIRRLDAARARHAQEGEN